MRLRVVLGVGCLSMVMGLAAQAQTVAEQYLLVAANQDREQRGLPPLRFEAHLQQAARQHAYEMVRHRTISHQFSGELELAQRAGAAGARFSMVSENVAEAPNAGQIHELWMHSEGHRENLMDPRADSVGIAVIEDRGEFYAVEDFARTVRVLSFEQQESQVAGLLTSSGLSVVTGTDEARATCGRDTGYAGRRQPWFVMRFTAGELDRLPQQLKDKLATGRFHEASVGACSMDRKQPFSTYSVAVLLYP